MQAYQVSRRSPVAAKRAGIYVRVSTDEQEDNSSLEFQLAACQRLAEKQGYEVVAIYRDVQSGADINRKQFNAMLAAIERREVDAIVCLSPDRLARAMRHQAYALVLAERAGVATLFVQSPPADTLEGRILETVLGVVAEVERTDIAKRTQIGQRDRVKEGAYLAGSRAPYGFRFADPEPVVINGKKSRAKTRLVADPVTAPIARRIFEHIAGGGSGRQLERTLTDEHIPTPSEYARDPEAPAAKPWRVATVRIMVRNPVYKGQPMAYRWKVARPDLAKVKVPLDPITEPIPIEGAAEALVSPELWQRANDQLDNNLLYGLKRNQDPEATLLRAGYAVCGYCGHPLVVNRKDGGAFYRCGTNNVREHGCPIFGMTTRLLDDAVWSRVMDVLTDPSYVRQYMQQWLEGEDTTGAELERKEAELAAIETKERRLANDLMKLDDTSPVIRLLNDLSARKRVLMLECNNLRMRRQTYEGTLERWDAKLARWNWQGAIDHPRLTNMSYAEKRFWLANLNVKAEVWQKGGGPEGQQYRVTMAIDESFWLPTEDELTGAWVDDLTRLEAEHPTNYHASLESFLSTRSKGCAQNTQPNALVLRWDGPLAPVG